MTFVDFLKDFWLGLLFAGILIGGFIYRKVTHQPYEGGVPPVGINNDLPSSITGINKHKGL